MKLRRWRIVVLIIRTRSFGKKRNRPLQKRERTGKEYGCFPFEKLRYSNERSTIF